MKTKLRILGAFIGHLAIGTMMFAALLVFGGSLNLLVRWAAPIIGDTSFAGLMYIVEQIILYADIVFILWWAIYSTYQALKEMSRDE